MHFSLSDYDYPFDSSLIAQAPCEPRDHAKLMVVNRKEETISHHRFDDLPSLLNPDDLLVLNDSKVIPARLFAHLPTGGKVELLLHRMKDETSWEVFSRPAKKLKMGTELTIASDFFCKVEAVLDNGLRLVRFSGLPFYEGIEKYGKMPLPPYIQRETELADLEDYQTVFANAPGSVAAPTAGLHFTDELLEKFTGREERVTLHVGAGTFLPVKSDDIREHKMHTEMVSITEKTAEKINNARRVCCVGTTACRSLESMADLNKKVRSGSAPTDLFIYPGYEFLRTDILLTNFHLPKTTLLTLVCTFGGHELILKAYREAVENGYHFFSYGDAMLIL